VTEITQATFEALPVPPPDPESPMQPMLYFEHQGLLGVILLCHHDKDWNVVVLKKDPTGRYRAHEIETSFTSESVARDKLLRLFLANEPRRGAAS